MHRNNNDTHIRIGNDIVILRSTLKHLADRAKTNLNFKRERVVTENMVPPENFQTFLGYRGIHLGQE